MVEEAAVSAFEFELAFVAAHETCSVPMSLSQSCCGWISINAHTSLQRKYGRSRTAKNFYRQKASGGGGWLGFCATKLLLDPRNPSGDLNFGSLTAGRVHLCICTPYLCAYLIDCHGRNREIWGWDIDITIFHIRLV